MKICLCLLLVVGFLFACTKEKGKETVATGDEIEVMVYATPANDTIKVASTNIVHIKLK